MLDHTPKNRKKTIEDYHALAEARGFRYLGGEPVSTHTSTLWECAYSHKWNASYSNIKSGKGCPYCAKVAKKTEKDYHSLAKSRSFEWIGTELPPTVITKTMWRGDCGHEWSAHYNNISSGKGCGVCRWKRGAAKQTKGIEHYYRLASERGIKYLGSVSPNVDTPVLWECANKHKFKATYSTIKGGGGCVYCSKVLRKSAEDYHKLIERGFIFIGEMPKRTKDKTWWKCKEKGHVFESTYDGLRHDHGCPRCVQIINGVKVSKPQIELCKLLNGEINFPVGSLRIDIALLINGIKIGVELDIWYWHKDHLQRDKERYDRLISLGWRMLSIKTQAMLPDLDHIHAHIERLLDGDTYTEIIMPDWGKD